MSGVSQYAWIFNWDNQSLNMENKYFNGPIQQKKTIHSIPDIEERLLIGNIKN
jgi:hypothetical protein